MSDTPQGNDWWQASDGKWYPPQQAPGAAAPTPPPFPGDPAAGAPAAGAPAAGPAPEEPLEEPEKSKKGKVIAIVVLILVLIAAGVAAFVVLGGDDETDDVDTAPDTEQDDTDTDTDIGDATGELVNDGPIEFNTEYEDALEESRTEARYTLDAPDGAIMTLTVSNDAASTRAVFTTFESAGEQFASFRVQPGSTETETIILNSTGGAPFELMFTEGPAAYTFEVGLEVQDDAGGGGDAGEEFADAFAVDAGQGVTGLLGGQDGTDHYTVEVQSGTELTFDAAVERGSERAAFFTLQLNGDQLFAERVQPGADTSLSLLLSGEDSGELEIIVTEGPGTYSFTADFVTPQEGGERGDAPGDLANARTIDISSAVEGQVGDRDDGDYYLFTAPSAALQLSASSEATSERAYLVNVQDESGSGIGTFRVQPGATATETFEVTAGSTVRLVITEGRASYSISIS